MRALFRIIILGCVLPLQAMGQEATPWVLDVNDIQTFKGQNNNGVANVNIEHYSSSIPYGGGQFVLGPNGCSADGGVIIEDQANNCYYRQFSGPVHLSWYGALDASGTTCLGHITNPDCDSTDKLKAAFLAAQRPVPYPSGGYYDLGPDGGVVTDGRPILIEGDVHILSNGYLSCGGPPGGGRAQIAQSDSPDQVPYYTLPNSIFLNPNHAIVRDANSRLTSCIIEPDWYYAAYQDVKAHRTTRKLIDDIEHAFTGTATRCGTDDSDANQDGAACDMHDVLILGFDVCDDTRAAAHAVLTNLKFECNVGEFIHNNGGGTTLASAEVENFIESGMTTLMADGGKDFSRFEPAITGIAQDTGNGEVQIATTGTPQIADGDTVLISGIQTGSGPVGQNARWIVECSGASPCLSGTFDLKGSSWAGPSYGSSFWKAGTNVIKTGPWSECRHFVRRQMVSGRRVAAASR
jgi:hypothetical protein